jgi:hypothetical protein
LGADPSTNDHSPAAAGARRIARGACLLLLCLVPLTGCASKAGLQSDGTYALDRSEQNLDCDRLYKSIWGRVQVLKGLPARIRAEQSASPSTAWLAFGRMFGGSGGGVSAMKEYDRERAHIDALHRAMIDKKCVPLDLDRELAATTTEVAELRRR